MPIIPPSSPPLPHLHELALFAGTGGGILGGKLLGWKTVCAVEIDSFCREILMARQSEGMLNPFPVWDDVRTFDGRPWRGLVDIITGGFPCQDISVAGKCAGIDGEKSGMWYEMQRIIAEVEPPRVLIENSVNLRRNGMRQVLSGLSSMGYNARWGVVAARHAGAPHRRNRIWILAYTNGDRLDEEIIGDCRGQAGAWSEHRMVAHRRARLLPTPGVCRVANGLAHRVDRLKAIGNGQVPAVVRLAWNLLNPMKS